MPTNLKTLLSRSRSRNELKLREKGDESPPGAEVSSESSSSGSNNVTGGSGGSGPGHVRGITTIATAGTVAAGGIDFSSSTTTTTGRRKDAGCKSFFSCSALHGVGLVTGGGAGNGEGRCVCTPGQQNLVSSGKSDSSGSSSSNCSCYLPALGPSQREMRDSCGSLRKCETVLALSSFQGNHIGSLTASSSFTSSSSASDMRSMKGSRAGTPTETHSSSYSSSSSGRVKVMKDKIFSTSSSTLNNLIHSSSSTSSNRTRLFPSWKVSSGATSTTTGAAAGAAAAATTTPAAVNSSCSNSPLCCPNGNSNGTSVSPLSHLCHGGLMLMSGSNSRSQLSISENAPMTPVNRLRRNVSATNPHNTCFLHNSTLQSNTEPAYSRSSSVTSFSNWKEDHDSVSSVSSAASCEIFCRLCLSNYKVEDTCALDACSCRYCKDCLVAYVSFEIEEGAYDIACPDATCDKEGVLSLVEIEHLVPKSLMDKHRKFRLYREVEKDGQVMWCPTPGCETICMLQHVTSTSSSEETKVVLRPGLSRSSITCATCAKTFCAECKLSWHPEITCESHRRKLVKQGKLSVDDEEIYAIESIKKCPFCYVPIEKDSGCAQMMCKRCKHVFCWYCLASLDDDFLLRHYDKGPCKNKLGHSRASVVWHRAQVIGIFAGFGVLVLLASPLLILAAPCLLCCRCRYCANKLDPEDPVSL